MTFPIHGACRVCGRDLLLRELTNTGSTACPNCGTSLSRDYSFLLLEEAKRADVLAASLAGSLKTLAELPGNLSVDRDAVYAAITAPLPIDEQRQTEREQIRTTARQLRESVRTFVRLPSNERRQMTPKLTDALRALAQRIIANGARRSEGDPAVAVLRDAAEAVEAAAARIRADEVHAGLKTTAALDRVDQLVC